MRPGPGTLVAVGGAEDKREEMVVLRRALAQAAGPARRVEVIPTASREPREAARPYLDAFHAIGATEVGILDVRNRTDAAQLAIVDRARRADLIYMTGGDQARLSATLRGTPLHAVMREKIAGGGVVAGTSAGAAAMSSTMIAQGSSTLRKGHVHMVTGLSLLPTAIIDTHFAERGRFGRLIEAVASNPRTLGIGLGENTAIVVRGHEAEVVGAGSVVVMDGRQIRSSNVAEVGEDEPLSVEHMIVHTFAAGRKFRLDERRLAPIPKAK